MTNFPTLYKKISTGAIQSWATWVDREPSGVGVIFTQYGQVNGKQQLSTERITEGKNVGKANETTPYEQAVSEAKSEWEKKVKKGYVQTVEEAQAGAIDTSMIAGGVDPMLAHTFEKQGHKIKYPAYVQPKLDGHRCIAIVQDGVCTLWSRTRKPITSMPHIVEALETMFADVDIVLDGELYNHDYREKFEELTSKIRQTTPAHDHWVVQYWVYDVVDPQSPFSDRNLMLNLLEELSTLHEFHGTIIRVPTFEAEDEDTMMEVFAIQLEHGFEGAMARNAAGLYKGRRSYDLQKLKRMYDEDYRIIGIKEGKGKMAGHAIFECTTQEGKNFTVKLKGPMDYLKTLFNNSELWQNKWLTVQLQGVTQDGIPRFPVGLRIREDI